MKVGDKVRIRTGRRGNPPRGEVIELVTGGDVTRYEAAWVKRRTPQGAVVEQWPLQSLTVVNATEAA